MSNASKICTFYGFQSREEDRAYLKGFRDALEWINDEMALGWSDVLDKELGELKNEGV